MSSFRQAWRINDGGFEVELVLGGRGNLVEGDGKSIVAPGFVSWRIDEWLMRDTTRATLIRIYDVVTGHAPRLGPGTAHETRDRLVRALERGELVALRIERRSVVHILPVAPSSDPPPPMVDEQEPDVFVLAATVTQVGDGDKPVARHPVRIIDPDTREVVAESTTDEKGVVRAEVPKDKTYRIEIVKLDPQFYPEPIYDMPPEGVVHFRVVDEGGSPLAQTEVKVTMGDDAMTLVTDDDGEVSAPSHLEPYAVEIGDDTFYGHAVLASDDEEDRVYEFVSPGKQDDGGAGDAPTNRLERWFPMDNPFDDDDASDDGASLQ